jgi:hypothetical protein
MMGRILCDAPSTLVAEGSVVEIDGCLVEVADPPRRRKGQLDPVKEALAVKTLRESLAAVDADDEALLLDTIEGETQLFEIIDALLDRMQTNRGLAEGLERVVGEFEVRKRRFEKRIEDDRALIEQALTVADLSKIERPAATLFLSIRAPKVEIVEEADIPARFWKTGDPKLDRKAIAEALKAKETVPGAHLSNGAPSLSVRTL